MSQTAFVTGGTGFLGRHLVRSLVSQGVSVRCLVRNGSDVQGMQSGLTSAEQSLIQLVKGDLEDRAFLDQELPRSGTVYHLAATVYGSPSTLVQNTLASTQTLIDAAVGARLQRFVLVSSLGVYGTRSLKNWGTLTEETPIDPHPERRDAYTFSKIRQEAIAWEAHETQGLPLVVIRPGVLYGPGRSLLTSRVGLALGPLFLRMGGGEPLPYTFVENCADAIVRAGLTPGIDGEVFNVVDDQLPTGKRILNLLREHGTRVRALWIPRRLIGVLSALNEMGTCLSRGRVPPVLTRYKSAAIWSPVLYSNDKLKRRLSWFPRISTEDALQKTVSSVGD